MQDTTYIVVPGVYCVVSGFVDEDTRWNDTPPSNTYYAEYWVGCRMWFGCSVWYN